MGQQQLLLIVLGVFTVAIAIVVGINIFNYTAVENNKSAVVSDLNNLAGLAMQYYKAPFALAGGEGSFIGFKIPKKLEVTDYGTYNNPSPTITPESIVFHGVGVEAGVKFSCTVDPKSTALITIAPE